MKPHPCRDCLIVPICKQKSFLKLVRGCEKIHEYLFGEIIAPLSESPNRKILVNRVRKKVARSFIELTPIYWKPSNEGMYWSYSTKHQRMK